MKFCNPEFAIGVRTETSEADTFATKKVRAMQGHRTNFLRKKKCGIVRRIPRPIANSGFNPKGSTLLIVALSSAVFVIIGLALMRFLGSESIMNMSMRKSYQARQNAVAGIEAGISDLKNKIESQWLSNLFDSVENTYFIFKNTAGGPVDITEADLQKYLDTALTYSDFIVDWLNGSITGVKFTNIINGSKDKNRVAYLLSHSKGGYKVYDATVTLTADPAECGFGHSIGSNKAYLQFNYEITSTGYERTAQNEFARSLTAVYTKPLRFVIPRESAARYALASDMFCTKTPASPPTHADYVKWWVDSEDVLFDGPVFAGGDLYLENYPQFKDFVHVLSGVSVLYNSSPAYPLIVSAGDLTTPPTVVDNARYNKCFLVQPIKVIKNSPMDVSIQHDAQEAMAKGGNIPGAGVNYYAANNSIYIVTSANQHADIELRNFNSDTEVEYRIKIMDTASNTLVGSVQTVKHSVSSYTLTYCTGEVFIKGELAKDAQITIATKKNIYITDNLKYSLAATFGGTSDTVLGLISWEGDILFRLVDPWPIDWSTHKVKNYFLAGVFCAYKGGFGVWWDDSAGLDILNTYYNDKKKPAGQINVFGSIICKNFYGTFAEKSGILYGFGYKATYDRDLLNKKLPPFFPSNGRYYISMLANEKPRILDVYSLK